MKGSGGREEGDEAKTESEEERKNHKLKVREGMMEMLQYFQSSMV